VKTQALAALDFRELIRPGDQVMWGQAAEPVALIDALMSQRAAIGAFISAAAWGRPRSCVLM
jgi:hypothetical protein